MFQSHGGQGQLSYITFEACFELDGYTAFSLRPSLMSTEELHWLSSDSESNQLYLTSLFQNDQLLLQINRFLKPRYEANTIFAQDNVREYLIIKRVDQTSSEVHMYEQNLRDENSQSSIDCLLNFEDKITVYDLLKENGVNFEFQSPTNEISPPSFR